MKKVLVVQHVPHESLGIIGPAVLRGGFMPEYLKVYENHAMPRTIEGYSALIVLGGPMAVYEEDLYPFIKGELKLIESALKNNTPTLGVCLGAQMMAKAAGSKVYEGGKKEIGWYGVSLTDEGVDDRLFMGLSDEFTVFQWHGDTFDVPENAELLASSKLFPNQVIRIGSRAYGVQFHLEVTESMIREWIEVNGDELAGLKGVIDPEEIIRETPENIAGLHACGRTVVERFLRMID
ncbi:MAG: gamma-glutamyl-gamma-aminobutyrate hydrolase family protein [Deltaproteobacteria bacterium]|nr:gamma-glutamyl-gamma-aminobutyrate hydrolase family protein [Deltaproteobacteria bacterium]